MASILVMSLLMIGLALYVTLPSDFRASFSNPATPRGRLLARSLGLVAIVTLIAEIAVGQRSDNGLNGLSPCLLFGIFASLVLYGRAAYFMYRRHLKKQVLPMDMAQVQ